MKSYLRYFLPLFILLFIICSAFLLINSFLSARMDIESGIFLIIAFAISTILSLLVFKRGLPRMPDEQTMHTFVAVGIKFLAELFITLGWFVIAKKTTPEYILLFFILYLTFSMFSIIVILKALKKKSL